MTVYLILDPVGRASQVFLEGEDISDQIIKVEFVAEVRGQTMIRLHRLNLNSHPDVTVDDYFLTAPTTVTAEGAPKAQ